MMGVGLGVSRLLHGRYQAQAPAPCQRRDPLTPTWTACPSPTSRPVPDHHRHHHIVNTCELCCQVETCCRIMSPIALPWPLTIASCTCDHSTAHVLAAVIAQDQHVHPSDSQSSQHSRQPGSPHRMATSPVQCSTLEPPIPCRRRILLT
jgi:hypothetical protein